MASIAMRNVWHTSPAICNVSDRIMTVGVVYDLRTSKILPNTRLQAKYKAVGPCRHNYVMPVDLQSRSRLLKRPAFLDMQDRKHSKTAS